MEIVYRVQPGPRARFAQPVVEGSENVSQDLLRRASGVLAGEPYDPRELDRVRRDVLALGVFGTVRARTGDKLDDEGRLPVTFLVAERPFRALGATAAYETRYGPTIRAYWEHRNLFGGAERLRIEGEISRTAQTGASTGPRAGQSPPALALRRADASAGRSRSPRAAARLRPGRGDRQLLARAQAQHAAHGLVGVAGDSARPPRWTARSTTASSRSPSGSLRRDGQPARPDAGLRERGGRAHALLRLRDSSTFVRCGDRQRLFRPHGRQGQRARLAGGPRHAVGRGRGAGAAAPALLRGRRRFGPRLRLPDDRPPRSNNPPRGGLSLAEGSIELRQRITGLRRSPSSTRARQRHGAGPRLPPDRRRRRLPLRHRHRPDPGGRGPALLQLPGTSGYGLYVGIGQAF